MNSNEMNVEEIYKKDSKLKREDVKSLLDWMTKQPHLPKATELQAILFLHSCYYSNEAAKSAIDNYFTIRTICADMFSPRTLESSHLKESLECSLSTVLPGLSPSGDTIILGKLLNSDPAVYNLKEQFKYFDVVASLHLHQHGPVNGLQIVLDMKQATIGHLMKANPVVVKKFLFYIQEAMPIRIKYIHVINVVSFIDMVLALVKPFMKKELIDSLLLHPDINTLYQYIPQDLLPIEYGGSCPGSNVLIDELEKKIAESEDILKFQENQLVDESKRQGQIKNAAYLFGIEGSFKKLEVD